MINIFEAPWFLLTIAAAALAAAGVLRQIRPEWGYRPLLVPLLFLAAAFGADHLVETDREQIIAMIRHCRQIAVRGGGRDYEPYIAETYRDPAHPDKQTLLASAERILSGSGITQVAERSHELRIEGAAAVSQLRLRVIFNPEQSRYALGGNLIFVALKIHYMRQPEGNWQMHRIELVSVNDQPLGWKEI